MLKTGSFIWVFDDSGAILIKILNIKKKKNFLQTNITLGDMIIGVVQEENNQKKKIILKKKTKVLAIVVVLAKKRFRGNGIFISATKNVCIPIKPNKFLEPIASNIKFSLFFEINLFLKYKSVQNSIYSIV